MTAGYQAPLSVLPFPVTGRREALQKLRAILRKSAIPPCVPRTRRRNMLLRRAGTFVASVLAAGLLGTGFAQQDMVIAVGTDAVTLDVHAVTDTPTFNITGHIFETLFRLSPEGNVEPHLATGYEISDDGKIVSLTLRDDVTFHDGTPFNAEAVKANIERIQDPEIGRASCRERVRRPADATSG